MPAQHNQLSKMRRFPGGMKDASARKPVQNVWWPLDENGEPVARNPGPFKPNSTRTNAMSTAPVPTRRRHRAPFVYGSRRLLVACEGVTSALSPPDLSLSLSLSPLSCHLPLTWSPAPLDAAGQCTSIMHRSHQLAHPPSRNWPFLDDANTGGFKFPLVEVHFYCSRCGCNFIDGGCKCHDGENEASELEFTTPQVTTQAIF